MSVADSVHVVYDVFPKCVLSQLQFVMFWLGCAVAATVYERSSCWVGGGNILIVTPAGFQNIMTS